MNREMTKEKRRSFSGRSLVSVLTAFCFAILAITGIVLFITPPGRVANWTGWRFLALTKAQWGGLHIWFALVFLIVSGFHIYFNWRPLINYFKSRATRRFVFRLEWVVALVVCVLVFIGTLVEAPPFSSLIAWNESVKDSWEEETQRAPIPHAELLTLKDLATETGVDLKRLLANLRQNGIVDAVPESIVGDLAKAHGMSPNALFEMAAGKTGRNSTGAKVSGAGMVGQGRKTLEQICVEKNLDVEKVLEKLRTENIEADRDTILRDIAFRNGIDPPDLLKLIEER